MADAKTKAAPKAAAKKAAVEKASAKAKKGPGKEKAGRQNQGKHQSQNPSATQDHRYRPQHTACRPGRLWQGLRSGTGAVRQSAGAGRRGANPSHRAPQAG